MCLTNNIFCIIPLASPASPASYPSGPYVHMGEMLVCWLCMVVIFSQSYTTLFGRCKNKKHELLLGSSIVVIYGSVLASKLKSRPSKISEKSLA